MLEFRCISHINHIIHKTEPSLCPTKGLNHNSRPGQPAFQPNCRAVGMPPLAIGPQAEAAQSGKTDKAIGKHGAHFQTTAGRHDGQPLAKATGMLPRASTTIARYACRIYIRHHPKKSSRHRRATPPPCCMLTMQGSNIMPATAMQGMLPDAFLAACIYRCT